MSQDEQHDNYVNLVYAGKYPYDPRVPLPQGFSNESGDITNVLFACKGLEIKSVAIIQSFARSIRSNHFHRTDWHFMYVVSGRMDYYWRSANPHQQEETKHRTFVRGELMFTPPMVQHAVFFPEPTVLLTLARNSRKHQDHEDDLVRCKLIEFVNSEIVVCV
jgi:uncharacterized RmlC-like cupin family protein